MANNKNSGGPDCPVKKTSIGGQALIEGIMMRGPKVTSMAVRNTEGCMVVESWNNENSKKPKFYKWPFIRGIFGFIESMAIGYRCLMRSAEIAGFDDDGGKEEKVIAKDKIESENSPDITKDTESIAETEKADGNSKKTKKDGSHGAMTIIMVIATVLGVGLAILLFKALPEGLYQLLLQAFPSLNGKGYGYQLLRSLVTGIMKIFIVVGYMAVVALMKDIKRTFMYHGAEHKTITCYENGLELTVENVRKQSRFHPRCGTSFLILVVIVGVFVTMFIPARLSDNGILNVILRTLISLALLPLMMSLGYELIRIAGKKPNLFTRIISAPGMWLQRITTREPEDDMIECAITALKNVIPDDGSDVWGSN